MTYSFYLPKILTFVNGNFVLICPDLWQGLYPPPHNQMWTPVEPSEIQTKLEQTLY
jgi:hypothetical protein